MKLRYLLLTCALSVHAAGICDVTAYGAKNDASAAFLWAAFSDLYSRERPVATGRAAQSRPRRGLFAGNGRRRTAQDRCVHLAAVASSGSQEQVTRSGR